MRRIWIVAALSICVADGQAVEPYTMQPHEIAQMPDYCQVKMTGGTAAEQRSWAARFGPLWIDMHHYCHGLKFIQRASRPSNSDLDRSELSAGRLQQGHPSGLAV